MSRDLRWKAASLEEARKNAEKENRVLFMELSSARRSLSALETELAEKTHENQLLKNQTGQSHTNNLLKIENLER